MSDNEHIVEAIKKDKKPRTEKQKEAFEKMIAKRKEIDLVKNAHKEAIRKEKEIVRKDRVNKIKEVEQKMSKYKSSEEDEEEEIVKPVKVKAKPKKKVIVQEESSSDDEPEIVYVKKSKPKKKPKKKKVVVEETSSSSSEDEPVKPKKKYATTQLVNQRSNDELKAELVNQRLLTAMRSLGYID
jgi:hypothetical protein